MGRPTLRAFLRDAAGVSALEFALILPIMLLLLVGMTEMSNGIDAWRKVTLLSRAVADLTAQGDKQNPMSAATMADILKSSKLVLRPFDATNAQIVVSALGVDIKNLALKPRVCSSAATANAKARAVGVASDLNVPPGFQVTGTRYILAEVTMPYAPMLGSALVNQLGGSNGQITLVVSTPWPTRGGQPYGLNPNSEVILPNGSPCAS
ncbi:TadE/TadG family type IV pilus assembly protein [Methylobacterium sp. J-068]|uniref:TadE/TadG family type IV pilus assembly protein n=1 Tax=Methylobacterium sp. J-068 TaxID=2836649 RepID=UPI001FBBAF3B|nr:TadE/TadG family type IV pilus assembly protein [Methylobacterium sp. J-068]MCJ2032952.1 pilus assembly protein [Methylobacterium sp. J-068]